MQWPWKFAQGTSGPLWIAFRYVDTEPVIGRYDPASQQLELIKVNDQVEEADVVQHGTRHVRLDDRGWLWMTRRGVLVYDGQAWHPFYTRLPDSHFSDTRLTYEDREGNIWVGLGGGGLVFCDPVSVKLYTEADGLPDCEVRCVGEDREGRLWIGTMGGASLPRRRPDSLGGSKADGFDSGSRSTGAGLERRAHRTGIQGDGWRGPSN